MNPRRVTILASTCLVLTGVLQAAPLPCDAHGKERWPVKTTVPADAKQQTMTLDDALKIQRLNDVRKDDPRYQDNRITDQPVIEDTMVTVTGYLYLVAFESDDCDFHIQLTTHLISGTPTSDDNSMIVEVPSGEYATTVAGQVEGVRQWVIDKLLAGTPPKMNSVHVMQRPVYVTVTGALFYDDAHTYEANGGTGRGKKKLESKTLWELHPVTAMAFAPKPSGTK
jgi:hypothetical protein